MGPWKWKDGELGGEAWKRTGRKRFFGGYANDA